LSLLPKTSPKMISRSKMAPLSALPIFFNLQGKNILLVGSSERAAERAELLLAAGAKITLVGQALNEAFIALFEEWGEKIDHFQRNWIAADLQNIRLAIAELGSEEESELFAQNALRSNVPIYILGNPKLCDFQFGEIINRSPVLVSVSTLGTAPELAQQIQLKFETLLPQSLGKWAKAAKSFRKTLNQALPRKSDHTAVWRDFARHAMTESAGTITQFIDSAASKFLHNNSDGHVTLVGAGPGDHGLLTIQAIRALQSADIILFDKLVSNDVLSLARRETKRMLVGKRGGKASCRQDDINALMIKLAKQGKHVVRLKSGDPMIFGRAGEEISILEAEGISVQCVPGVSAAMAAASRLGVSLTHRDHAQSVKFVTAHSRAGKLPDIDWTSCADRTTTLMVYMGAKTAPQLAKILIEKGLLPSTAVLIAKDVSGDAEDISYHHLSDLLDLDIDRTTPVLLGIGSVFDEKCQTYQNRALNNFQTLDKAFPISA